MQELFLQSIEKSLSAERLAAYRRFDGETSFDAVLRYLWNTELCSCFYAPLQHLEVTLRNAMHSALVNRYETELWFDCPRLLSEYQTRQVADVRRKLLERHQNNAGKIVADLSFGFWTALLHKRYSATLLPPLLKLAFKDVDVPRQQKRAYLSRQLTEIRQFRNRVFHHEPIWTFKDLHEKHSMMLQIILWLNPDMFRLTMMVDTFNEVYQAGTKPYNAGLREVSTSSFF